MIILAAKKPIPQKFIRVTSDFKHINIYHNPPHVYNKLHGSSINIEYGDYISIQNEDDMYPVKPDYFDAHYEVIKNE